ncbi:hypothetical protein C8Q76DRAFT_726591 [Earliella scabrosa]|nr:hypothetical protein C8Q76DRAFT_726591 [Earliella scabrosa]
MSSFRFKASSALLARLGVRPNWTRPSTRRRLSILLLDDAWLSACHCLLWSGTRGPTARLRGLAGPLLPTLMVLLIFLLPAAPVLSHSAVVYCLCALVPIIPVNLRPVLPP